MKNAKQTKLQTIILMGLATLTIVACKANQDPLPAPATTPAIGTIAGTYCLDFSLVGSEMVVTEVSDTAYSIAINDFDGGLRSGTGDAVLSNGSMTMMGTMEIEMGVADTMAVFAIDGDTLSGTFSVLAPNGDPLINSTLEGRKGACQYSTTLGLVSNLGPLLTDLHVDLGKIVRVSKYRSAAGHNYVDYSGESCVNLKHYFLTYDQDPNLAPASLDYYAPAAGTVVNLTQPRPSVDPDDWEMDIRLDANPDVIVRIFHFTPNSGIEIGTHLASGDHVGEAPPAHLGGGDLSVFVMTTQGYRHVSAFEIMASSVQAEYVARGVNPADWKADLYYETNDPYVAGIYCDQGTWGNLEHAVSSNYLDDYFLLN